MSYSDRAELYKLVDALNQAHLVELLQFAAVDTKGSKLELVNRARMLIDNRRPTNIDKKIREMFAKAKGKDYAAYPGVKFIPLAFYDRIGPEVIQPSKLLGNTVETGTKANCRANVCFQIRDELVRTVLAERTFSSDGSATFVAQLQLRIALYDSTAEDQLDKLPPYLQIRVNDQLVPLPKLLPIDPNKKEHPKRPPRPLNITQELHLRCGVTNRIVVDWLQEADPTTKLPQTWLFQVEPVRQLTSEILLERLKVSNKRDAKETSRLIKKKWRGDNDAVAATNLTISLICPISMTSIKIPLKAEQCEHLACFDGLSYLKMNERTPVWKCPVCDRPAPYDKLFIDNLIDQIVRTAPVGTREVSFTPPSQGARILYDGCDLGSNGNAAPKEPDLAQHQPSNHVASPTNSATTAAIPAASPTNRLDGSKTKDSSVVDLTNSDDEEPPAKRPATSGSGAGRDSGGWKPAGLGKAPPKSAMNSIAELPVDPKRPAQFELNMPLQSNTPSMGSATNYFAQQQQQRLAASQQHQQQMYAAAAYSSPTYPYMAAAGAAAAAAAAAASGSSLAYQSQGHYDPNTIAAQMGAYYGNMFGSPSATSRPPPY